MWSCKLFEIYIEQFYLYITYFITFILIGVLNQGVTTENVEYYNPIYGWY